MIFKLSHISILHTQCTYSYIRTCKYTILTCTYSMHTHAIEVLGGLWQNKNLGAIYNTVEMGQYCAASNYTCTEVVHGAMDEFNEIFKKPVKMM